MSRDARTRMTKIEIVARTAGNVIVVRELAITKASIAEGKTIAEPLQNSKVFPGMVVQMIAVGEQTGAMDAMLGKLIAHAPTRRDAIDRLAHAAERLGKSCKRLIWLNPLLRFDGFQPKARGVRAILPMVSRPVVSYGLHAEAQVRACAAHDDVTTRLGESYQEKQQAFGLIGEKAIVELFVSAKGSWTIIVTGTDGNTCILAAGEGWESIPVVAGPEV